MVVRLLCVFAAGAVCSLMREVELLTELRESNAPAADSKEEGMEGISSKIIEEAKHQEKIILDESASQLAELKRQAMEDEQKLIRAQEEELKEVYRREVKRAVSRGK